MGSLYLLYGESFIMFFMKFLLLRKFFKKRRKSRCAYIIMLEYLQGVSNKYLNTY